MRIIIRFSLNHDTKSSLRNRLKPILEKAGIKWTGSTTGTYEGYVSETDISNALSKFWREVARNKTLVLIDHFWMYTDRQPEPIIDPLA